MEGTGCTDECKIVVCPALGFDDDGGTIAVRSRARGGSLETSGVGIQRGSAGFT